LNFIRTASQCKMCALRDRNRVWAERPAKASIAVIAEAPGEAEDIERRPLIGPSGKLFHAVLKNANVLLERQGLWITNTICCRPPHNDIRSHEAADALTCCAAGLRQELRAMREAGVKVVIVMGNTAQHALGLDVGRGNVMQKDGLIFVSTYHPAFVLRGGGGRKEGSREPLAAIIHDFKRAKEIATSGWKPPAERFILEPSLAQLEAFVERVCKAHALLGVDTETTGLSPWRGARVVVCGFATSAEDAFVVPFIKEHGFPYWKNGDDAKARALVQRIFRECQLVFQNAFFDVPMLRVAEGFDIPDTSVVHDTLVVHSLVAPEEPHNLEYITSTYGKTQAWKAWFKDRDKPITEIDQVEMRRYNARDCVVLHQVLPPMLEHLDKLGLRDFYLEETQRLVAPIMQMTMAGVAFEKSRLSAFTSLVNKKLVEAEAAMLKEFDLPPEFDIGSDEELRYFIYGVRPSKFKALTGTLVRYTKHLKSKDKEDEKFFQGVRVEDVAYGLPEADVISVDEVPSLGVRKPGTAAYEELRRLDVVDRLCGCRYTLSGWEPLKTDSGKLGVGKEALLAFRVQLLNRLDTISKLAKPEAKADEVAKIEDVLAFLDALGEISELEKLKSSFTTYGPDPDGRVRPSWKMHGTATGRLSCQKPNLEQLPSRGTGLEVRRFFHAAPGCKLVSSDGENLEVALLGFDALDPVIIDIYVNKKNIHDMNTRLIYRIDETHPHWGEGRKAAKIFQFGGRSYGGGDRTIHRKMLVAAPHLSLTFAQYVDAAERWTAEHPAYAKWRADVEREVTETRMVRNAFGRVRIFLGHPRDIKREAMNFRIQSAGACIINRAMVRLYERLRDAHMASQFVLQIHDQLILECPDAEASTVAAWLKEEIERPFVMHGITRMVRADSTIGDTYADV
jgi:uracil-DNA glycosylase family 4